MPGIFVEDTFTAADGTSVASRAGETGATWTAHPTTASAAFTISANRAYPTTAGILYASGVPDSPEYTVEADFHFLTSVNFLSINARQSITAATYYRIRWDTNVWAIASVVANTSTTLQSVTQTLTAGTTYAIKAEITDATKKISVDGVAIISVTDNTITEAGRVAIRDVGSVTATTGKHFDRIVATNPVTASPPQTAYATADVTDGAWTDQAGSNVNLFAAIDEVTASDADYIRSDASPATASAVRLGLGTLGDPAVSTGHIVRYRLGKDREGGDTLQVTARLYQGATLISTDPTVRTVPDVFTTYSWTLTGLEADAITLYSDLRVDFSAIKV